MENGDPMPTTLRSAITPSAREGEALLRAVATSFVRLSRRRQPGDPVYDDVTQRAYNHLVLVCLRRGVHPPESVPGMVRWGQQKPLTGWPIDIDPATVTSQQLLVDPDTRMPTQFCLEWAMSVADPLAEQFENQLVGDAIAICRAAQSPASYTAFRRVLIERPVLTVAEFANLSANVDLLPLIDILGRAYDAAPASLLHEGAFHTCARCGCLLVPTRRGLRCELDRCAKEERSIAGRRHEPHSGGGIRYLQRPLRVFITGPGIAEIDLERDFRHLGLTAEMWPNFDAYDLRVSFPDGQIWAIDVKDRANPALLGRTTTPFRRNPFFSKAFLVVPSYRLREREDYERVFLHHIDPAFRELVTLRTDTALIRKARLAVAQTQIGQSNA